MSFLKNKIAKSAERKEANLPKLDPQASLLKDSNYTPPLSPLKIEEAESPFQVNSSSRKTPCENIIKNYGRAMANFALSSIAAPYLQTILPNSGSTPTAFQRFIKRKKKSVNCIKKLRDLLPTEANREAPNYAEKKAFQALCIVFLKFFSVNWLFNSKIDNKPTHLAYRFKIMRRVKDPNRFTYLKDFKFEK